MSIKDEVMTTESILHYEENISHGSHTFYFGAYPAIKDYTLLRIIHFSHFLVERDPIKSMPVKDSSHTKFSALSRLPGTIQRRKLRISEDLDSLKSGSEVISQAASQIQATKENILA